MDTQNGKGLGKKHPPVSKYMASFGGLCWVSRPVRFQGVTRTHHFAALGDPWHFVRRNTTGHGWTGWGGEKRSGFTYPFKKRGKLLGGGFKYFLFSPLLEEMIQFD